VFVQAISLPYIATCAFAQGGKKKRAKKDPNAPKGATSAFMYFSVANREQVCAGRKGRRCVYLMLFSGITVLQAGQCCSVATHRVVMGA
jgi:hypothetical protein